jgi:hypothetical protein
MTAPVTPPCTCGQVIQLGTRVGKMRVWLRPGSVFDGSVQLINKDTGLPEAWPAGMSARLVFTWGTGAELIVPGTVDVTWLRFHMTEAETEQVPARFTASVQLNYGEGWTDWVEGGGCA